jgi:glycosyltransferase involved in cell wall biosynthesis
MKTSIVIPVKDDWNIFYCLKEVLIQKTKNSEIIVVNDYKSSNSFTQELKNFCKEAKVRCVSPSKPGASANRNFGMRIARGRNIVFIDSDCYPCKGWLIGLEEKLERYDLVEGKVTYEAKKKGLMDRVVENSKGKYCFLTANFAIKKKVASKCFFDERFLVFREDTDFGLSAIEQGFRYSFCEEAEVFHKASRFTVKRFIFERKRYIGEPLFFKKHKNNYLIKKHSPSILRISFPGEFFFLVIFFLSLFFSLKIALFLYLLPGLAYCFSGYIKKKRYFKLRDFLEVILLIPLTIVVKRLAIWQGAIRFKFFLI